MDTYKEIYKYWHDHGVEMIVHHSDSYAATLVPYMIEMGIDIWQGALRQLETLVIWRIASQMVPSSTE